MIADTSLLISFYIKDDVNHTKAVEKLERHKQFLVMPDYVVGETATVLLYKKNLKISKLFLETIENTQSIKLLNTTASDLKGILETFKHQKKQLSFVDAAVVYHARRLRLGVLAFDGNIHKEIEKDQ
jgi:predicted nucleic acid-binding protein